MKLMNLEQQSPITQLRLRLLATALLSASFLAAGYFLLRAAWLPPYARQWLVQAAFGISYMLWVLLRNLKNNHRNGEHQLLPGFGAGNIMTLTRGALIAALAGYLFLPWPFGKLAWVPAILYTLAVLADFLDGFLARLTNRTTRMGEQLDISFDGIGVLVASLLAIQYGQVPFWYLIVAVARYVFLAGVWLRKRLNKPVYELRPSLRRRAFAGVQMGFLFFILMPVFSPPGTNLAAAVFALPFMAGFVIDWFAVSGIIRIHPSTMPTRRKHLSTREIFLLNWLPVGLRLAALILLAVELVSLLGYSPWKSGLPAGKPFLDSGISLLIIGQGLVLIFLTLGVSGRLAVIIGLCLLGLQQMFVSLSPNQIALVFLYTAILYLGTGSLSLWKPEEYLIYHHVGERS